MLDKFKIYNMVQRHSSDNI